VFDHHVNEEMQEMQTAAEGNGLVDSETNGLVKIETSRSACLGKYETPDLKPPICN
jgi:hypothetical protein